MRRTIAAIAVAGALLLSFDTGLAQQSPAVKIRATVANDVRAWDSYVTSRQRAGELRPMRVDRDPSLPARTIERLQQYHQGVPIWGAQVVRDSTNGVAESIFGELSSSLTIDTAPTLSSDNVEQLLVAAGDDAKLLRRATLAILPLASGEHRLVYTTVVSTDNGVYRVFVDAHTAAEVLRYSEIQTQSAVGTGRGVLGDTKKLSVLQQAGAYFADDQHRPPDLTTYDLRADFNRTLLLLNGLTSFLPSDVASDVDNDWTDASAVDAHVHVGWTYDYYFKRHGRRGLDNQDRRLVTLINAFTQQGGLTAPSLFVINAFWCDACGPGNVGLMFFGNGVPSNFFMASTGQNVAQLAGGIDVAAHELTHGVTSSSSNLIYLNESGALNEAFSDIMGTAVEFYYQTPGPGRGQADYLCGEDVFRAVRAGSLNGIRSMDNPRLFGQPDHYNLRYTGTADGGGVHINSGIANHVYYLAIEGGTNRTSGLSVQGVGPANREQIEKVFYRAFVFLLPANATFATARVATIQAAIDLYGPTGAAVTAVTQAWTAVGVS